MRMILTLSFWVCFFSLKFGCPLTFPFNVIVFLCLSLCLHMLSMYVWFCPHHDNPSLPAEGKLRRSYNAGPPVALSLAPFIYFFSPLSFLLPCLSLVIITLTALRRLKLCVCVCVPLFAAWGALKALWEEKRGLDIKTRDKGRRVFFIFSE